VGTFTPSWIPSSVGGDYANITIAYKSGSPVKPNTQPIVSIITEVYGGHGRPHRTLRRPQEAPQTVSEGFPFTARPEPLKTAACP
jgi:hypothetical protein